jgi:hypothetical protein
MATSPNAWNGLVNGMAFEEPTARFSKRFRLPVAGSSIRVIVS